MKEFISKNAYFQHLLERENGSGNPARLNKIQELLTIRYRRKARTSGFLQFLRKGSVVTIELADVIRKDLVCSEAFLVANRTPLLGIDPLKEVVTADVDPYVVYEFWLPNQNYDHGLRVLAYIEVVKIQGNTKVMVRDVAIMDSSEAGEAGSPKILRTVGGLHISLNHQTWLKAVDTDEGPPIISSAETRSKIYF